MPTIRQITLPDGVTYDLAATAINREVVPIVTEYSGSETTFNALEVTEDSLGRTFYNINNPAGNPIFQWVWDGASELQFLNGSITVGGTLMPYGGESFSNGGQYFENATALPAQTAAASYNVLCIDSFASGGRTKYCTATSSATANTIVTRQANGYIYAVFYNSSNGVENIASYTNPLVMFADASGWQRKTSLAHFKSWLGLTDSGTQTLNATYKCYYRKVNGMCTVSVDYRGTVSKTITVGTLPSGYRPHTELMAANATGGPNTSYLIIGTGGVVQLAKVGSGGYCIATITYPGF